MRERLYRGKDKHTGKWVFGSLIITEGKNPVPEITIECKRGEEELC